MSKRSSENFQSKGEFGGPRFDLIVEKGDYTVTLPCMRYEINVIILNGPRGEGRGDRGWFGSGEGLTILTYHQLITYPYKYTYFINKIEKRGKKR